jgi:virulence-associated protein VagC
MPELNLPAFDVKVSEKEGKRVIFDPLRRKYVALTPEEWVRQHFVNYLLTEKHYPKDLLANEVTLRLNATTKRCDTIVYNRFLSPLMIVEYKAPEVAIKRAVFDQISRYNASLKVRFLTVSNGIRHFCCRIDYESQTYTFLESIPAYDELAE